MSLYGVMRTSASGMAAQASRISGVAENVANANTPGYSRQVLTVQQIIRTHKRIPLRNLVAMKDYPPDMQEKATETVLQQAEVLSEGWAGE